MFVCLFRLCSRGIWPNLISWKLPDRCCFLWDFDLSHASFWIRQSNIFRSLACRNQNILIKLLIIGDYDK
jgi:hypothetical protein